MRIIIELEKDFGHPANNRPTKQALIQEVSMFLPKFLASIDDKGATASLRHWEVSAVRVEGQ